MQPDLFLVISTFPDRSVAKEIAKHLITSRLAACANIIPSVDSIFVWNETLEESSEAMVLFKVAAQTRDSFLATLSDLHPYDVPELLVIAPSHVSQPYADWVKSSTPPE